MTLTQASIAARASLLALYFILIQSAFPQSSVAGKNNAKTPPASVQAQISAVLGRDERAYQAAPRPGGFAMENLKHDLAAEFTGAGIRLRTGTAAWGLRLRGYGYGDKLLDSGSVSPQATANRVEYQRGALTEWFVNGPMGLEQGFNVAYPPGKSRGEPLTLAFDLSGDLSASVDPGGRGLSLKKNGIAALRYGGLIAHDMTGRELRAWMETSGENLWLRVDDAGAQYPVVVDPIVQQATLTASDGGATNLFGASVAISGNTVVVGAEQANIASGQAYVFVMPAAGWSGALTETAKLRASEGGPFDAFGSSVSINEAANRIVVGARTFPSRGGPGHAYVFVKPASGWSGTLTESAILRESVELFGDWFGVSVAMSGNTIVVGANNFGYIQQEGPGAAFVYVQPAAGWSGTLTESAKLTPTDTSSVFLFGTSVGISGDTIVVGPDGYADCVFVKPVAGWAGNLNENAKLIASDGTPLGTVFLNASAAISGDTIVAGAPTEAIGANSAQGSAYVFLKPAAGWSGTVAENAKLTASDGSANSAFGTLVGLSGNLAMIYAPGAATSQASAYVFTKPAAGWSGSLTEDAKLTPPNGLSGLQPPSIAVNGTTYAIGAPDHQIGQNANEGWAWIYTGTPADFSLSVPNMRLALDGSSSVLARVQSLHQFVGDVSLTIPRTTGIAVKETPAQVTLSSGGSATSTVQVTVAPYVTPQMATITLTGSSGTTVHSHPFPVTVVPTTAGISNVVAAFLAEACVDSTEANALTVGLTTVQADINARNIPAAKSALNTIITQIKGKGASHFKTSCGRSPAIFSPALVVVTDLQALGLSLGG